MFTEIVPPFMAHTIMRSNQPAISDHEKKHRSHSELASWSLSQHLMRVALTTASVDMDTFFKLTELSKTVKMKFQHEYM